MHFDAITFAKTLGVTSNLLERLHLGSLLFSVHESNLSLWEACKIFPVFWAIFVFAKPIAIGVPNLELVYSACIRHIESQSSSFQLGLLLGLAKGRTCSNAHTEQLKPVPSHTGKCVLCTISIKATWSHLDHARTQSLDTAQQTGLSEKLGLGLLQKPKLWQRARTFLVGTFDKNSIENSIILREWNDCT